MRSGRCWTRTVSTLVLAVVISQGTACGAARAPLGRRLDRTVITRDQMLAGHFTTVYDAVLALRSTWLSPRGVDSFISPSIVWVYVDGTRAGDVTVLQDYQPRLVNTVRFYDGITATGRWGVDNGSGVIYISTWADGDAGILKPDSTRAPKPPGH